MMILFKMLTKKFVEDGILRVTDDLACDLFLNAETKEQLVQLMHIHLSNKPRNLKLMATVFFGGGKC
jgi:hypothetical protein